MISKSLNENPIDKMRDLLMSINKDNNGLAEPTLKIGFKVNDQYARLDEGGCGVTVMTIHQDLLPDGWECRESTPAGSQNMSIIFDVENPTREDIKTVQELIDNISKKVLWLENIECCLFVSGGVPLGDSFIRHECVTQPTSDANSELWTIYCTGSQRLYNPITMATVEDMNSLISIIVKIDQSSISLDGEYINSVLSNSELDFIYKHEIKDNLESIFEFYYFENINKDEDAQ